MSFLKKNTPVKGKAICLDTQVTYLDFNFIIRVNFETPKIYYLLKVFVIEYESRSERV